MPERPISVIVFKPEAKTVYYAQWTDPATGRKKTRSTGTPIKRDAERWAVRLQDELNEGKAGIVRRLTWKDFRAQAVRDFLPVKRATTRKRYTAAMNAVEKHLNPLLLSGIDAAAFSDFASRLRDTGNSDATVAAQLRHLKALLRWGWSQGMIPKEPKFKIQVGETAANGRALTDAEFEELLKAVPDVVGENRAESWRHLLRGLWLSGLRIGEAMAATWDDSHGIRVELDRAYPLLFIPGRLQKSGNDSITPLTPDFAEFLRVTPPADRTGYLFNPAPMRGSDRLGQQMVEKTIAATGKLCGVVVKRSPLRFASAHDLRRSFCARWSARVLPQVLRKLARHRSVQTTLEYYAESNATITAEAVWKAVAPGTNHSANPAREGGENESPETT